jgi:hypothetical protein
MTESDRESLQARIAELERQLSELRGVEPAAQAAMVVTALGAVPEPLVQKPFAAVSLLRAVRNALDSRESPMRGGG